MGEHREQIDRRMAMDICKNVLVPLVLDLGGRYLVQPYLGKYDDDLKSLRIGLGHKDGGDKRHRTAVEFKGIQLQGRRSSP